ncbi:putative lipoprotein [Leptospira broomii serovar Hurstbridge str. 5399]|uniref:Lipoprotein n=1 Tax=Leptospira broomii serovar Hurstbridge str. 5399 TaxID=1049789 RepID=T0EZE6_9LEPT|nr:hypothetical protein [Leptospira broomii]EQA44260.1 putative lipoprotein [Leptospira broomii serovar Hurstbridge str. 5399]
MKKYRRLLYFPILFLTIACSQIRKNTTPVPVIEPRRAEIPLLVQFETVDQFDAGSIMATFYTGAEGKDRRADREYAKFPILIGSGARAKELELEGTIKRRESFLQSERMDFYLYADGTNLSHNCGLGVEDRSAKEPNLSRRSFRAVKLYFRGTGVVDMRTTTISYAIGFVTYFLYNVISSGFRMEKLDCGIILEG